MGFLVPFLIIISSSLSKYRYLKQVKFSQNVYLHLGHFCNVHPYLALTRYKDWISRGKQESTNKTRDEMISGRGHSFIIINAFNVKCKFILLDSKYLLNVHVETERCRVQIMLSWWRCRPCPRSTTSRWPGDPSGGIARVSKWWVTVVKTVQWSQQTSNMSRYIRAVHGASRNFTMPSAQVSLYE